MMAMVTAICSAIRIAPVLLRIIARQMGPISMSGSPIVISVGWQVPPGMRARSDRYRQAVRKKWPRPIAVKHHDPVHVDQVF